MDEAGLVLRMLHEAGMLLHVLGQGALVLHLLTQGGEGGLLRHGGHGADLQCPDAGAAHRGAGARCR